VIASVIAGVTLVCCEVAYSAQLHQLHQLSLDIAGLEHRISAVDGSMKPMGVKKHGFGQKPCVLERTRFSA
jgi:hypothetical protein